MRPVAVFIVLLIFLAQGLARQEQSICGTHRDLAQEEVHLHRRMLKKRAVRPAVSHDVGDIAVVEDSGDIVARRNDFNLDRKTVQFSTVGGGSASYRFQTTDPSYDASAASAGIGPRPTSRSAATGITAARK